MKKSTVIARRQRALFERVEGRRSNPVELHAIIAAGSPQAICLAMTNLFSGFLILCSCSLPNWLFKEVSCDTQRHHSRRWFRHPPTSADAFGQQAADAGVRQADDLLPDQYADAGRYS